MSCGQESNNIKEKHLKLLKTKMKSGRHSFTTPLSILFPRDSYPGQSLLSRNPANTIFCPPKMEKFYPLMITIKLYQETQTKLTKNSTKSQHLQSDFQINL